MSDSDVYSMVKQVLGNRGNKLIHQQKANGTSILDMLSSFTDSMTSSEKETFLQEWGISDKYVVGKLKRENMSLSARGSISDIIEGCTGISYPLGVGHKASYHQTAGMTAKEFFAETMDGKVANPKSLEQMRRVFPNGVKVVEEIIQEAIK